MFADPQSFTYNSVAYSMPRIVVGSYSGEYRGEFGGPALRGRLKVAHTMPKDSHTDSPEQHYIEISLDEDNASTGDHERTTRAWLVVRTQDGAQNSAQANLLCNALVAYLTPARVAKLIGGES